MFKNHLIMGAALAIAFVCMHLGYISIPISAESKTRSQIEILKTSMDSKFVNVDTKLEKMQSNLDSSFKLIMKSMNVTF
jgi:hypothetical protein